MIRIGKITAHSQQLFKFIETSELLAVVKRHRLELVSWYLAESAPYRQVHTFGRFVFHFCYDSVSAFTFHMAGNIAASALSHHRIRLPVANAFSFINNLGTLVNQTPIRDLSTLFLAAITLTPFAVTLA